jgi:hypothetical protein
MDWPSLEVIKKSWLNGHEKNPDLMEPWPSPMGKDTTWYKHITMVFTMA